MKRAHRSVHRLIWLALAPFIAIVLVLAVLLRPPAPENPELPAALIEEAG